MLSEAVSSSHNSVRYSRAGDVFHYRWAARRCLKLIYPNTTLRRFVVEGSSEPTQAGEHGIDLTEYDHESGEECITYFQLKHSTTRIDQPFTLSGLRDTIKAFAARFRAHEAEPPGRRRVTFKVVTNRPISADAKSFIRELAEARTVPARTLEQLHTYTQLRGAALMRFCTALEFVDTEGDFSVQHRQLHAQVAALSADPVETSSVDKLVALIQNKALTDSDGEVVIEEVLQRFGVTSISELFPAPSGIRVHADAFPREQHDDLVRQVFESAKPVIVHASGGVGKSVFATQLAHSLPTGSVGVLYDCFGAGTYRNRSRSRHHHRTFCVQIANELAALGLCEPLINGSSESNLMRSLLHRLGVSALNIRRTHPEAVVLLLVDAADNAEMAATEFIEQCFAHELLRETLPEGCRLVLLCRTERIGLLQPSSTIELIELPAFSPAESFKHLRTRFAGASAAEGQEFHRLSSANPRVQANALETGLTSAAVVAGLGPSPTTVDDQIARQLETAVAVLRDSLPTDHREQIVTICRGLANLPPYIPLEVLATAAEVDVALVRSFASDLGRPLYLSENSVHFRDEPTETWFRTAYAATSEQIRLYVLRLGTLANASPYAASALPGLLLASGQYDELIRVALSDESLPLDQPVDARTIRVYRLQFALRAALRERRYSDAARLTLRAAEETAGKLRERELMAENLDLVAQVQAPEAIQELAFRKTLRGDWDGSENICAAGLLVHLEDFKGDARAFLRSSHEWLNLHFESQEQRRKTDPHVPDLLSAQDIATMTRARLMLDGSDAAARFLASWIPLSFGFETTSLVARQLIDAGDCASLRDLARAGATYPQIVLAINTQLSEVGQHAEPEVLHICLAQLIADPELQTPSERDGLNETRHHLPSALLAFVEGCVAAGLPGNEALGVLETRLVLKIRPHGLSSYDLGDVHRFLRFLAVRAVVTGDHTPDLTGWFPAEWTNSQVNHSQQQHCTEYKQVCAWLFPWYLARAQLIADAADDPEALIETARTQSQTTSSMQMDMQQRLPFEAARLRFACLTFARTVNPLPPTLAQSFLEGPDRLALDDLYDALRASHRLEHLQNLRVPLETACRDLTQYIVDDRPEERARRYVRHARAVLAGDRTDAAAYFDGALEAVSKFGDEVTDRWRAVSAFAERACATTPSTPQMAYRYIRCAELVGETVYREKHWDRAGALEVCLRLDPPSALSALSRWRDRHVGRFEQLLPELALAAVTAGALSPASGWALSAFPWDGDTLEFAESCVERVPDQRVRQIVFDTLVRDLRLIGHHGDGSRLLQIAQRFALNAGGIKEILEFQASPSVPQPSGLSALDSAQVAYPAVSSPDWSALFDGLNLVTASGLDDAKRRFEEVVTHTSMVELWRAAVARVPESDAKRFLEALLHAETLNVFDVQEAIKGLPASFKAKISVQRYLPEFARALGRRFAVAACTHWTRRWLHEAMGSDDKSLLESLCTGILEGIASADELSSSSTLFGLCELIAPRLTLPEAHEVLDYALGRFELHVADTNADGPWSPVLEPPATMVEALAGFLWSALGSPRSAERWQAAHAVRRLAANACQGEIDALVAWMERDAVGAFGAPAFPFYRLHARQYLLIALARVAIDHPTLLLTHASVFARHALHGEPHALIQKYAAQIALNIEGACPNMYPEETVQALRGVGISAFPMHRVKGQPKISLDTPWHRRGEVDLTLDVYLSYDFDRYWFPSLAYVFDVRKHQIEELARDVIVRRWGVQAPERSVHDPRRALWDQSHRERETWHSHATYPRADNHAFYLSWHAMLSIAAMLFGEMPIVEHDYDHAEGETAWTDWLERHDLTRADGRWLADRRDPAPLERPEWLRHSRDERWRLELEADENLLIDPLLTERDGATWLRVDGSWDDGDREREECVSVESALVAPAASEALLNALSTCDEPSDRHFFSFDEQENGLDVPPFELRRWIGRAHPSKGLDDMDPHAGSIDYPPHAVEEDIVRCMKVRPDLEHRQWIDDAGAAVLASEIWGEFKKLSRHDEHDTRRRGSRLSASLTFLQALCRTFDRHLILRVEVNRSVHSPYRQGGTERDAYRPPSVQIYLFTGDDNIRSATTRYRLGQSSGG